MVVATIQEYDFNAPSDFADWGGYGASGSGVRAITPSGGIAGTYGDFLGVNGTGTDGEATGLWNLDNIVIPGQTNQVTVTFDIYELGNWDNPDHEVELFIREEVLDGGTVGDTLSLGNHDQTGRRDVPNDDGFSITKNSYRLEDIDGGEALDQRHNYTITFDVEETAEDRTLDLIFTTTKPLSSDIVTSFGIDNLKVEGDTNYLSEEAYEAALSTVDQMALKQVGRQESIEALKESMAGHLEDTSIAINAFNLALEGENLSSGRINGTLDYQVSPAQLDSLLGKTVTAIETWQMGGDGLMDNYVSTIWEQMDADNTTDVSAKDIAGKISAVLYLAGSLAGGVAAISPAFSLASKLSAVAYAPGSVSGTAATFHDGAAAEYFADPSLLLPSSVDKVATPGAATDTLIFELTERGIDSSGLTDSVSGMAEGIGNLYQNLELADILQSAMKGDRTSAGDDAIEDLLDAEFYANEGLGFDITHIDHGHTGFDLFSGLEYSHTVRIKDGIGEGAPTLNGLEYIELDIERHSFGRNNWTIEDIQFA